MSFLIIILWVAGVIVTYGGLLASFRDYNTGPESLSFRTDAGYALLLALFCPMTTFVGFFFTGFFESGFVFFKDKPHD